MDVSPRSIIETLDRDSSARARARQVFIEGVSCTIIEGTPTFMVAKVAGICPVGSIELIRSSLARDTTGHVFSRIAPNYRRNRPGARALLTPPRDLSAAARHGNYQDSRAFNGLSWAVEFYDVCFAKSPLLPLCSPRVHPVTLFREEANPSRWTMEGRDSEGFVLTCERRDR